MQVKELINLLKKEDKNKFIFMYEVGQDYEAGTLICLKMEDKFVRISDITRELRNIINSLPKYSCDVDSSIIGDLIKRLENAKQ